MCGLLCSVLYYIAYQGENQNLGYNRAQPENFGLGCLIIVFVYELCKLVVDSRHRSVRYAEPPPAAPLCNVCCQGSQFCEKPPKTVKQLSLS